MNAFDRLVLLESIPTDQLDRHIYHYTSTAGLLGILSSGTLRGSNAAFLNDASEISYGGGICHSVIVDEMKRRTSEPERRMLEIPLNDFERPAEPADVYVTSFSEEADHLGQWRAYGAQATGYCLGFKLGRFSERDILRLPQPVLYDRAAQEVRIRRAIALACDLEVEAVDEQHRAVRRGVQLSTYLRRLLCLLKHPRFADEREWRSVVSAERINEVGGVNFIDASGVLRPFVVMLQGSRETRQLPVEHVLVADRHPRALHATRLLLDRYGYDDVRVSTTEIPFA